jgi:hypothetical protein
LYAFLIFPMHVYVLPTPLFVHFITLIIFGEECKSLSSSSCDFLHLNIYSDN